MTQYERNRKAVQQGLDRRAAQRAEAAQDAADSRVYEDINRQGRENRAAIEQAQAKQQREEKITQTLANQEALQVKQWNSFMLRTYGTVLIAALFCYLFLHGGVQAWVAFPVMILAFVYIIVNFAAYITRNRKSK